MHQAWMASPAIELWSARVPRIGFSQLPGSGISYPLDHRGHYRWFIGHLPESKIRFRWLFACSLVLGSLQRERR